MTITNWKYVKEYTGVTSGSYMGRDDGYDVQKTIFFNNIRGLAKDDKRRNQVIYAVSVSEIDAEELSELIKAELLLIAKEEKERHRQRDLEEIKQLRKKVRKGD